MRAAAFIVSLSASLLLSIFVVGCGLAGGSDSDPYSCTRDYNKSNLPPLPNTTSFISNPLYYQQWSIHYDRAFYESYGISSAASINLDDSGHRFLGRSVKVAVIDDGLDVTHEDLVGAVVATYDVQTKTTNVTPRTAEDNHGTEVTGIIAARNNDKGPVGVAPAAQIYFIRMPFDSTLTESMIIDAFEKAKEWGVDVINCSWGSGDVSAPIKAAIQDVAVNGRGGKGAVVVFSAGNGGFDAIGDPIGNDESGIDEVIAVGATNIYNERTEYSNYGPQLDIMAPGGEYLGITTLDRTGTAGEESGDYVYYDSGNAFGGTSASAPIVSGVAALLIEANPNLTREDVYSAITCGADKIGGVAYDYRGHNEYYGYGKINANRSLETVR